MDRRSELIKELEAMSVRYHIMDVFSDVCGIMACCCDRITKFEKERERRYESLIGKYSKQERQHIVKLFAIVVEALEEKRESFLGPVLEAIGAANVRNGQFLTPASVAKLMARINAEGCAAEHNPGEVITMNDPACGCGVTLIAGAEALIDYGVSQADILIDAGDIDSRACDATFVELTLLGYAAVVKHEDALAMKELSRPRYTVGYYLHGMNFRRRKEAA